MEFRDLVFFRTIAEEGHLGRAADRLGRTKPALTKCVRRLEEEIDAPLFSRDGRRSVLTEIGSVLLETAREMEHAMDRAKVELRSHAVGNAGHIRIGTGPTVADYLLPSLFEKAGIEMPRVTTDIVVDLSDGLREALEAGRVDLIISTILPEDGERFTVIPFATDEVVVVSAPNHPLLQGKATLSSLLDYAWALPGPEVASRRWLEGLFRTHGLPAPRVRIQTSSNQILPTLLARTEILGFIPRSNLGAGRPASTLAEVPVVSARMERSLGVLRRRDAPLSPALRRFLVLVQEVTQGFEA